MLTEVQALEHLLRGFSNPVAWDGVSDEPCYCKTADSHSCCLCDAISDMVAEGMITQLTSESMDKKVKRYGPAHRTTESWRVMYWPMDAEGARHRAAFCRLILTELTGVAPEPDHRCPAQAGA